jgi:type II secretory pathway component PulL
MLEGSACGIDKEIQTSLRCLASLVASPPDPVGRAALGGATWERELAEEVALLFSEVAGGHVDDLLHGVAHFVVALGRLGQLRRKDKLIALAHLAQILLCHTHQIGPD